MRSCFPEFVSRDRRRSVGRINFLSGESDEFEEKGIEARRQEARIRIKTKI